jgi:hypothetical protein
VSVTIHVPAEHSRTSAFRDGVVTTLTVLGTCSGLFRCHARRRAKADAVVDERRLDGA